MFRDQSKYFNYQKYNAPGPNRCEVKQKTGFFQNYILLLPWWPGKAKDALSVDVLPALLEDDYMSLKFCVAHWVSAEGLSTHCGATPVKKYANVFTKQCSTPLTVIMIGMLTDNAICLFVAEKNSVCITKFLGYII